MGVVGIYLVFNVCRSRHGRGQNAVNAPLGPFKYPKNSPIVELTKTHAINCMEISQVPGVANCLRLRAFFTDVLDDAVSPNYLSHKSPILY